jgi:spermidine synthase
MKVVVFVLFFISGACGLIYEVVWSRMMLPIFGRSPLAVGTVLAAFMLGLALGSFLLGKYSDRSRNPLRLYALYEIGIGLTALLATFLLTWSAPVYVWVHTNFGESSLELAVCRFLIAFVPLIIPTLLMGATLPILARIVISQLARIERELGRLYAINTVGAVAGSLAAGFFLIRHLGLHGTIYLAVAGNLTVGIAAWLVSVRAGYAERTVNPLPSESTASPSTVPPQSRLKYRITLWTFALSGFASFAYEVFWTRSLVFLVGNTTYAFTLMLTAFLTGIALGGYAIHFVADRIRNPLRLFAVIEVLIGVFSAASLPLLFSIVNSESVRALISRMSGQLGFLAASNFGFALLLMLLPATLIGATFPLIGRVFLDDLNSTGTTVGKVYAVNTIGNVLGALVPGLLILPLMGIQKGIILMAALNVCLGIVIAFSWRKYAIPVVAATAVAFTLFAVFLAHTQLKFQFPSEYQTENDGVLFYKEGGLVTTKVWSGTNFGYKLISVDGINIGGTSDSDYKQQILAHLPKLLLKSYSSELSIGLGSGILAGESARHAALKRIVCVELSKGVVEGARFFSGENYNILKDARADIVIDDIADFVLSTREQFDIISADEKTTGKYASNSMSYSKEYYTLLKQHLAPGGVVIQWMPTDLPQSQYALAMRTFLDAFPHVMLWYFPPVGRFTMSNTVLVGSNGRIDIDPDRMRQTMENDPGAFQGLRKYGLTTADSVLAHFIAREETLRRFIPQGPVNSFEHPYYEFYSPREYAVPAQERERANYSLLISCRGSEDFDRYVLKGSSTPDGARLRDAFLAEGIFLWGYLLQLQGGTTQEILHYYERAIAAAPWERNLRNQIVSFLNSKVRAYFSQGYYADAAALLRHAVEIYPESAEAHYDYALMLLYMNDPEGGRELEQALTLNPLLVSALRNLGVLAASRGEMDKATEQWKKALAINPDDVGTLVYLGSYLAGQKTTAEGMEYLRRARRLAPENPKVVDAYDLGVHLMHGR